eukprot:PITA_15667
MVKTQSVRFEIEKFNGKNNFEIWKVKMHDLLVQQGVAKALLGKNKRPPSMTEDEWDEMDDTALSEIRLCLADDVLFNIVLDVKFDSEDKAITLLCSLPEFWDHFVTSISFSTSDILEFDDVVGALLAEETRKRSNADKSTSEVMMAIGRSRERHSGGKHSDSCSKSKGKKPKVKCWHCGKAGHLKKDYWKRKQADKEDSSTEKKEANTTDTGSVSDLRKILISLRALDSNGYKTVIQGGVMKIYKGILLVMKAKKVGNLFQLEGRTGSDHVSVSEHDSISIHLWHQRLGHMSERGLKILADQKLLPNLRSRKLDFCKHCLFGKQSKQKFKTGKHTSKFILDYIHSDVWGPAPTASYGGSSYFVSFIDDFSRKVWVYMWKKKSDVFTVFKQFRALVENNTGRTIKCLRTDNGGEFSSKEFDSY